MRRVVLSSVAVSVSLWVPVTAFGRQLTFEQRVSAQEAVERIHYAHQIGGTSPFEEMVPRAVLERKVTTYLEQSVALQTIWKTPLTDDMLKRELQRMATHTRMPDRLRELFAALGDDPFVIQECLARASLADRLSRDLFAFDESIHAEKRREADELRLGLLRLGVERFVDDPRRTVIELVRTDPTSTAKASPGAPAPKTIELDPEAFVRWRGQSPARPGEIGALRSERDAFVVSVVLEEHPGSARIAEFTVPKRRWDDWWNATESNLDARDARVVTDESSRALPSLDAGERSRTDADTSWNDVSLDDLSHPRSNEANVWTGSLMVVWGGTNGVALNTGGRYDPATDAWSAMSTKNAPPSCERPSATWTGRVVIVGGADDACSPADGGRYDPATDAWDALPVERVAAVAESAETAGTGPSSGSETGAAPFGVASPGPAVTPVNAPPDLDSGSGNQEMPYISETPSGFTFPVRTPVATEVFLGTQGVYFGHCLGGTSAGLDCALDADCPEGTCELVFDNDFCLSYNLSCSGVRTNTSEYGFSDVLETTYDSSPSPGRQTWIERNWNYASPSGIGWRPFHFALEVDANGSCKGGTNDGAWCTLSDEAGRCTGGGTCTGQAPTGGARWTFTPNNRNGNTSLQLRWPWAAINARIGTDPYWLNGFSTWMRSSEFNPGTTSSGALFTTYLDHTNDRRGPWLNGVYSIIDFNTPSAEGKVGWINAGYFDARISGSTPSRVITSVTGVRSEVNLASTGSPQTLGQSYGVLVQFNPSGTGLAVTTHTGILVNTPTPPGAGSTIATQNGLWIADQQLARSGGGGSAILVSSQTASDGSEGNVRLDGANWNTGHIQLFQAHLWRDATRGVLRYKSLGAPTSEADGNAVVTGTGSNSHGVVFWGVSTNIDESFDTGNEVCAASGTGLTCVETMEFRTNAPIPCDQVHLVSKWLAYCK